LVANIYASGTVALSGAVDGSGSYAGSATLTIESKNYNISFDSSKQNFIRNVLNTNPSKYGSEKYFLGETYENSTRSVAGFDKLFITSSTAAADFKDASGSISAESGYVVDDLVSSSNTYNQLFKFVGLNNGSALSKDIKVSIENVKASKNLNVTKYGTFDVVVRKLYETATQSVLERFPGVSLDPTSDSYIVKAIGDSYRAWNSTANHYEEFGTYANRSAFIRVQMSEADVPATALPHGFEVRGVPSFNLSSFHITGSHPNIPLVTSNFSLNAAKNKRFGLVASATGNADLVDIIAHRPSGSAVSDTLFHTRFISSSLVDVQYISGTYNDYDILLGGTSVSGSVLGFDMPMYGGFDAKDITEAEPFVNNTLLGVNNGDNAAYRSIKQAIDIVADAETVDMNILCVPGVQYTELTDYMLQVAKQRGDTLAIIDLKGDYKYAYENNNKEFRPTSVTDVIGGLEGRVIDNSYGAAYFPAVFVPAEGIFMPSSIAALGAIGGTEGRQALWFAPAGFSRGGLTEATSGIGVSRTALHLVSSDRDALYSTNINPIATFPNEGVVIFGQKTLQATPSALDRVNVRRLVNYVKKEISRAATRILFEPNVEATWNSFKAVVNPFLLSIKNGYGLDDAKIVLDETTTTADLVDRNIMYCKVYLKPTKAIEYIAIDFVVTNAGAAFTE
jgi:hypothetical protein